MRATLVLTVVVIALLAGHTQARADDGYRLQILVADVMGVSAMGGMWYLASDRPPANNTLLVSTGVAAYLTAGSIVHLAHGQRTRAAISLGVHAGAPALGFILGARAFRPGKAWLTHLRDAVLLTITGAAVAIVVDVAMAGGDSAPEQPIMLRFGHRF
ncbi:MAG: hypothetical protein AAGC55_16060 [Myxococcota bacterium]